MLEQEVAKELTAANASGFTGHLIISVSADGGQRIAMAGDPISVERLALIALMLQQEAASIYLQNVTRAKDSDRG